MAKITIKNIGPIVEANLILNKINVIMGPQSSGKSTISKIISFCLWLEKKYLAEPYFFKNNNDWSAIKELQKYHKLGNGYFSDKSEILYESDSFSFSYIGGVGKSDFKEYTKVVTKQDNESPQLNSKILYIPAERNFVSVVPNLDKYVESEDNLMDFVRAWYDAKRKFSQENKNRVLNLGVNYYYDGNSGDRLIMDNDKELSLQIASSGLQSVIPLLISLDYYAKGIYEEPRPMSVQEQDYLKSLVEKVPQNILAKLINARNYNFSQFIIEEPEQNLFPQTQRDLLYYIISVILNNNKEHKLIITTHSPYILYALNNCILGYIVKDNMPDNIKMECLSKESWINPDLVSIYEITQQGGVRSIKNDKTGTVGKHYFNGILNNIMDEYYQMLNYLQAKKDEK